MQPCESTQLFLAAHASPGHVAFQQQENERTARALQPGAGRRHCPGGYLSCQLFLPTRTITVCPCGLMCLLSNRHVACLGDPTFTFSSLSTLIIITDLLGIPTVSMCPFYIVAFPFSACFCHLTLATFAIRVLE